MGRYGTCFQHALPLLLQNKVGERKTICKSCGVRTDYRCKNRYGCCWVGRKKNKKNNRSGMTGLLNMSGKEKLPYTTNKSRGLMCKMYVHTKTYVHFCACWYVGATHWLCWQTITEAALTNTLIYIDPKHGYALIEV